MNAPSSLSILYGVTTSDRFLYHYTRRNSAELILDSLRLRLNSYARTRDPREYKDWQFWEYNCPSLEGLSVGDRVPYSLRQPSRQFSRTLKTLARVVCFCGDSEPLTGVWIKDSPNRGFGKPQMWQKYAGNHYGVCLVLDRKRFQQQMANSIRQSCGIYGGPVIYTDRFSFNAFRQNHFGIDIGYLERVGSNAYAAQHAQVFHKPLFFEKMIDWQQEAEFRWVVLSAGDEDVYVDISDSLVGVIFGDKTRRVDDLLRKLPLSTETLRMDWVNGWPWIKFEDVKLQYEMRADSGMHR